MDEARLIPLLTADDISDLKEFTTDFVDTLVGNWTYIRVSKTGTVGNAKIQGYI